MNYLGKFSRMGKENFTESKKIANCLYTDVAILFYIENFDIYILKKIEK